MPLKLLLKKVSMVAKRLVYPADRTSENRDTKGDFQSPLMPYKHQVGGHVGIFQMDSNHILKPVNESERDFYQKMPEGLRQWSPNFCCEIELKPNDFTKSYDLCVLDSNPSCSAHNKQVQEQVQEQLPGEQGQCEFLDVFSGNSNDANINPWALECQLRSMKSDHSFNRFMVLENLCRSYTLPNILDLKLGTRQYSDNATEEKKAQQIEKCDKSTSKKLGMRLCGLQYFDETLGAFQYLDKYFGRSLSEKQLFSLLSHFFRFASNDQVRTNDCLSLIEQIEQIKKEIQSTPGLRLFGVSLLIIMEGKSDASSPQPPIVRLIDFAHASIDSNDNESDSGCLMGLSNFALSVKNILNNE